MDRPNNVFIERLEVGESTFRTARVHVNVRDVGSEMDVGSQRHDARNVVVVDESEEVLEFVLTAKDLGQLVSERIAVSFSSGDDSKRIVRADDLPGSGRRLEAVLEPL